MNLYLASPQLSGNHLKAMLFDLAMGVGDMIIINSNKVFANSLSMVEDSYGGLSFVNTTPSILNVSGISVYLEYLYEFKEYNECIIPEGIMLFIVPCE